MCQTITASAFRPLKLLLLFTLLLCLFICPVRAAEDAPAVSGTVRIFDKDSEYEISENAVPAVPVTESNTYGKFQINGTLNGLPEKDGVPAYRVSGNDLSFGYSCTDELLTAGEDAWHLIDDTGKKVDGQKLKEKIRKGAVIVQISVDRKKWVTVGTSCNVPML